MRPSVWLAVLALTGPSEPNGPTQATTIDYQRCFPVNPGPIEKPNRHINGLHNMPGIA